jgi:small subunit ribosomal protein S11
MDRKKNIDNMVVNIHVSMNNTIMNLSDYKGNVLVWSSGGKVKIKGARKGLPATGAKVGYEIAQYIINNHIDQIHVVITGIGYGRENALRSMKIPNVKVLSITDNTPIVHNGCKPPKRSRK